MVAKMFGLYVREFAIGFGPTLFKWKGKETTYAIKAIPLGGSTAMIESEDDIKDETEQEIPESRTFYGVSPWKRICILIAGPLMNFLLAGLILSGIYLYNGSVAEYPSPLIVTVAEGSAAQEAGIKPGDFVVSMKYEDGTTVKINDWYDIVLNNQLHSGKIEMTLDRSGRKYTVTVEPKFDETENRYMIGIGGGEIKEKKINAIQSLGYGFDYTIQIGKMTVSAVAQLFTGRGSVENLSGTIGIYSYTKEAVEMGFEYYLILMANVSISLCIMNLVPIPVFDGGRVILSIIEIIIGKRINKKIETIVLYVGLALILLLFMLTTYLDVSRLING